MTRSLRDMATLLVLTMWALYNCVAPGHDHDGDGVGDYYKSAPDGSHWKELANLVLLIADVQRQASAHEVVAPWKGSLSQILVLAALFVFSVLALYVVVAEELLLQADILTGPLPVSCSAHQVLPTISTLRWLDLAAAVLAMVDVRPTLSGFGTCASVLVFIVAGLVFPKRLVGAKLWINRFTSGSCSLELVAGVGGCRSAP